MSKNCFFLSDVFFPFLMNEEFPLSLHYAFRRQISSILKEMLNPLEGASILPDLGDTESLSSSFVFSDSSFPPSQLPTLLHSWVRS